jgi:hypothetical protein
MHSEQAKAFENISVLICKYVGAEGHIANLETGVDSL